MNICDINNTQNYGCGCMIQNACTCKTSTQHSMPYTPLANSNDTRDNEPQAAKDESHYIIMQLRFYMYCSGTIKSLFYS